MDDLRKAGIGVSLLGVVITGEQACPPGGGGWTASSYITPSRTEVLMKLQMAVLGKKFRMDRAKRRAWEALRRELATVRLESSGGSKKEQDDLAFALALAV